jgi:hypothetical protein
MTESKDQVQPRAYYYRGCKAVKMGLVSLS